MMRDSRGRFVNDREHAANVLLEVALEEAQKTLDASLADVAEGAHPLTLYLDRATVADELRDACKWADVLKGGA